MEIVNTHILTSFDVSTVLKDMNRYLIRDHTSFCGHKLTLKISIPNLTSICPSGLAPLSYPSNTALCKVDSWPTWSPKHVWNCRRDKNKIEIMPILNGKKIDYRAYASFTTKKQTSCKLHCYAICYLVDVLVLSTNSVFDSVSWVIEVLQN